MIDAERYGGRRAYLMHLGARTWALMGLYSRLIHINWSSINRLVFVCKGNICRSPYAAARARQEGLEAASYGLQALDGAGADSGAIRNAERRQVDLSGHRSRRLRAAEIRASDLVLLLEPRHLKTYQNMCAGHPAAVSLLGLWTRPSRPYIADPYTRSDRYFQECFSLIDAGVQSIAVRIRGRH